MHRRTIWHTLAVAACAMGATTVSAHDAPALSAWRWKARLLLVFASADADPPLADQRRLLGADAPGIAARDIHVIEIVGDRAADSLDASRLRADFGVSAQDFAVILIGKDGGEKWRRAHPVATQALFGVIDRMPMRREEARQR